MRLFTAFELPSEVRAAVAAAAAPMIRPLPGSRLVPEGNLHVTLRFLGETPKERVPEVREAVAAGAAAIPAGTARIHGFGAFPNVRQPGVVWVGVDDPAGTIAAAERALGERLEPLGFAGESRPFTPHVTVARIDVRGIAWRRRGPFDQLVLPEPAPLGPPFAVAEVVLFASETTPQGSRYGALGRFPLAA